MPIGSSDGTFYKNDFEAAVNSDTASDNFFNRPDHISRQQLNPDGSEEMSNDPLMQAMGGVRMKMDGFRSSTNIEDRRDETPMIPLTDEENKRWMNKNWTQEELDAYNAGAKGVAEPGSLADQAGFNQVNRDPYGNERIDLSLQAIQEKSNESPWTWDTPLKKDDERDFRKWAAKDSSGRFANTFDYDMRRYWKENVKDKEDTAPQGDEHFSDKYKKPNHPTFSTDSDLHGKWGNEGGKWSKLNNTWVFEPGKTNLEQHSWESLTDYFQQYEPDAILKFPNVSKFTDEELENTSAIDLLRAFSKVNMRNTENWRESTNVEDRREEPKTIENSIELVTPDWSAPGPVLDSVKEGSLEDQAGLGDLIKQGKEEAYQRWLESLKNSK